MKTRSIKLMLTPRSVELTLATSEAHDTQSTRTLNRARTFPARSPVNCRSLAVIDTVGVAV